MNESAMELRSQKGSRVHPLISGSSAFTCQVSRSMSVSSICSGDSISGISEISTPSPPYGLQFDSFQKEPGISSLARDWPENSDYSNSTTPLHTPVNSRRGSHDSILSTDSRDNQNSLLQDRIFKESREMQISSKCGNSYPQEFTN